MNEPSPLIRPEITPFDPNEDFPCLKQSTLTGEIVLFTDHTTGTTVGTGHSEKSKLGRFRNDRVSTYYKPFDGTITLEQS